MKKLCAWCFELIGGNPVDPETEYGVCRPCLAYHIMAPERRETVEYRRYQEREALWGPWRDEGGEG